MLYHLIFPFHLQLSGLNIFRYITFRSAIGVLISLFIFLFFGKAFIKLIRNKTNIIIRKLTPEAHKKKSGTPSMGGILIVAAVTISTLISGNLKNPNVIICLFSLISFGILGFIDDYTKDFHNDGRGIRSKVKLLFQFIIAGLIVFFIYRFQTHNIFISGDLESKMKITEISVPFFSNFTFDLAYFYIPLAIIFIVGFSNAVNMTDGLDGLSIGLTLFMVLGFTGITYLSGHKVIAEYLKIPFISNIGELTVFTSALAGACLGFLWFNAHPAQIFMGDTGSLALGGTTAVIALLLKKELLLFVIGGVFIVEIASVIIQVTSYKLRKKRVFKMAPIHHHFEMSGISENKIIIRFWIAGAIMALIGLASFKIR